MGGQADVAHAIWLLREEIGRNMAMLCVAGIGDLNADCLIARRG